MSVYGPDKSFKLYTERWGSDYSWLWWVGRTGDFDMKVTWLNSESSLKTPVPSSVLKYRDLESHGFSKVTPAAQATVASLKSLSKRRWVPEHWNWGLQWLLVKKALAQERWTLFMQLTWSKCPWSRPDCPEALGCCCRLACCWLTSCHLSVLHFLQWHRSAASRNRLFMIQRAVRVILLCLSNLQKVRQDKARGSLKTQAWPRLLRL